LDVQSETGGSVDISRPGISSVETPQPYEEGTEVTIRAVPDSGYTFAEWEGDVPYSDEDESSITVDIDEAKDIIATFKQRIAQTIEISDITAGNSSYSLGDTASITTELTNDADSSQVVDVNVELSPPEGEVPDRTDTKAIAANDTASLNSQWDLSQLATGQYDLTVRVTVDSEFVTDRTETNIFEVTESTGPVNVNIETVTAQGDPVDGARITLTPSEGGSGFSKASDNGKVNFSSVRPGTYNLDVESTRLNQESSYRVEVDGTSELTRKIRFEPTEAVYGTVLNDTGLQNIPDATVSIPELEETAQTDAKGEFVFNSQIPDGEYEFEITVDPSVTIVSDSDIDTYTITKEIGLDRTVTFNVDANLKQPSKNSSALIREEDQLISIIVRNFEKKDSIVAEQMFIYDYGATKGMITGIQEFITEIWNLLTNLEELPKMIGALWNLLVAIYENPSLAKKLVSKMIEDILEKHEKDNPFEKDTVDYLTFLGGWLVGYGMTKIAISIVGTKGAAKATKIAKNATKIDKAVGRVKKSVSDDRLSDHSPLNKRINGCNSVSGSCSDANYLREIYDYKPDQLRMLKKLRDIRRTGRINYFNDPKFKGALDNYNPDLDYSDNIEKINNAKGVLIEYLSAKQLKNNLPSEFTSDFPVSKRNPKIVKKLDTDTNGNPTLPQGESRILIPEAENGVEFDNILVGRPPGSNEIKIYKIREATTGNKKQRGLTGDGKPDEDVPATHADKKYELNEKVEKLENKDVRDESAIYGGIPYRAFKEIDIDNVGETVATKGDSGGLRAFDNNIQFDNKQMTDTAARMLREHKEVKKFTQP
jgi:hypothetical protein